MANKPAKKLSIRPLKGRDIFGLSRALDKMGLKVDLAGKTTMEEVGADFMLQIFSRLGRAEPEVLEWVASLVGVKPLALAEKPLEEVLPLLAELGRQPGFVGFLGLLRGSTISSS